MSNFSSFGQVPALERTLGHQPAKSSIPPYLTLAIAPRPLQRVAVRLRAQASARSPERELPSARHPAPRAVSAYECGRQHPPTQRPYRSGSGRRTKPHWHRNQLEARNRDVSLKQHPTQIQTAENNQPSLRNELRSLFKQGSHRGGAAPFQSKYILLPGTAEHCLRSYFCTHSVRCDSASSGKKQPHAGTEFRSC